MKLGDEEVRLWIAKAGSAPSAGTGYLIQIHFSEIEALCREVLAAREYRDAREAVDEASSEEYGDAFSNFRLAQEAYDKARSGEPV